MAVRLSALRAGRPPFTSTGRFLVLISVKRLSRPQGYSAAGRIRSIEKSSDLRSNRTRDLSAFSIVPQPTTLPCGPVYVCIYCLCISNTVSRRTPLLCLILVNFSSLLIIFCFTVLLFIMYFSASLWQTTAVSKQS
jgi:hypothetical protein